MGTGMIAFSPFTAFQVIRFIIWSGTRSSLEKSSPFDSAASLVPARLVSLRFTREGRLVYASASSCALKLRHRGVAAASYCVIGGMPKISSIVRTIEEVVYIV